MALKDLINILSKTMSSRVSVISCMKHGRGSVLVLGLILALVTGCQPKGESVYVPPTKGETLPTDRETTPAPTEQNKPKVGETVPEISFPKPFYEKKVAGSQGYTKSSSKLTDLGQYMDAAMSQIQNGWGQVDTLIEVKGARLSGKADLKIRSKDTFIVQFYDPKTEATLNRIVSDGKVKAVFYKDTWKLVSNDPSTAESQRGVDLDSWQAEQLRMMFANFESGQKVWTPLMSGLATGKSGFKAVLEEQTMKVLGKNRTLLRVLAERPSDSTSLEIVVDGARFLPVTVKSIRKLPNGKQDTILWMCKWNFGSTFADREFLVPVRATGP